MCCRCQRSILAPTRTVADGSHLCWSGHGNQSGDTCQSIRPVNHLGCGKHQNGGKHYIYPDLGDIMINIFKYIV